MPDPLVFQYAKPLKSPTETEKGKEKKEEKKEKGKPGVKSTLL
jgi:hypothetical protein